MIQTTKIWSQNCIDFDEKQATALNGKRGAVQAWFPVSFREHLGMVRWLICATSEKLDGLKYKLRLVSYASVLP